MSRLTRPLLSDEELDRLDEVASRFNAVAYPALAGGIGAAVLGNNPRLLLPGAVVGGAAGWAVDRYRRDARGLSRGERRELGRALARGREKRGEYEYTNGDLLRGEGVEKSAGMSDEEISRAVMGRSRGRDVSTRAFVSESERRMSAVRDTGGQFVVQAGDVVGGRMGRYGVPGVVVGAALGRAVERRSREGGLSAKESERRGDRAALLASHAGAHMMGHAEEFGGDVGRRLKAYQQSIAKSGLKRVK